MLRHSVAFKFLYGDSLRAFRVLKSWFVLFSFCENWIHMNEKLGSDFSLLQFKCSYTFLLQTLWSKRMTPCGWMHVCVCGYTCALKMKVFNLAAHSSTISNIGFGFLGGLVQSSILFLCSWIFHFTQISHRSLSSSLFPITASCRMSRLNRRRPLCCCLKSLLDNNLFNM